MISDYVLTNISKIVLYIVSLIKVEIMPVISFTKTGFVSQIDFLMIDYQIVSKSSTKSASIKTLEVSYLLLYLENEVDLLLCLVLFYHRFA